MPCKILIIDDSEDDQLSHQRALRDIAAEFTTTTTMTRGLVLASAGKFDAIVLDYHLPDGNGLDFIRQLQAGELENAPPVVMLTGSGNEAVAVEAMKAGAYDYLIKDIHGRHQQLLPTVVARVIREHTLRLAKQEADRQLQLAATVYYNITEGIVATRPDGTIVSANPALCAMTGYTVTELIGATPRIFKSERQGPEFYEAMWQAISRDGCWQGEVWNRHKNGRHFLVRQTITAIRDNQARLQHYIAVQADITEAKKAEEFVRHQAFHDPLTDLPNRALFMDRLRHQVACAERQQAPLALLFIDLDEFKPVNDQFGHDIGDELLKQVAARLLGCLRESDTAARLGGDEFTVILNRIQTPDDAAVVAHKVLEQLCRPFAAGGHALQISASIGIALFPANGKDVASLLAAADEAMYRAKRAGKAAYAFAGTP